MLFAASFRLELYARRTGFAAGSFRCPGPRELIGVALHCLAGGSFRFTSARKPTGIAIHIQFDSRHNPPRAMRSTIAIAGSRITIDTANRLPTASVTFPCLSRNGVSPVVPTRAQSVAL